MLKSYLLTAFRTITRNRISTAIHVLGLMLGMATFIMIMEYVSFEKSVNQFHTNASRIYRVLYEISYGGKTFTWESVSPRIATRAKEQLADVKEYCRVLSGGANGIVSYDNHRGLNEDKTFREESSVYADASFFSVFSFPIKSGSGSSLSRANAVSVSETMARKYFGEEDPLGKILTLNNQFGKTLFTVTSVHQDFPENSDLKYDLIFSLQTLTNPANLNGNGWANLDNEENQFIETYLLTQNGTDRSALEKKLNSSQKNARPKGEEIVRLQSLRYMHLSESLSDYFTTFGTLKFLYILQGIAFLIIVIALFNYINLSTAGALKRAREVGVRKVIGARRKQLVQQFFSESILLFAIALFLAMVLVNIVQPSYNHFIGKTLSLFDPRDPFTWWSGLGMLAAGAIASGCYCAFSLSAVQPVQTLKGSFSKSTKGVRLRQVLVVFQFAISIFLIGSTFILYRQMEYMKKSDLGVDLEQRVVLREPEVQTDSARKINSRAFLNDLGRQTFVKDYCMSGSVPGNFFNYKSGGVTRLNPEPGDEKINYSFTFIDDRFLNLYGIPVVAGQNFKPEMCSVPWKQKDKVMVNTYAMHLLGFSSAVDAVGQKIRYNNQEYEILGIIKDYHHFSLQKHIDPVIFFPMYNAHYFTVLLSGNSIQADMQMLEKLYKKDFPGNPFDFFFADEKYNQQYHSEQQYGVIFSIASVLAIVIACLGLLGLATFAVAQRIKEIGIRKVLGATVLQTTTLLSKDFLNLILVAIAVSTPISWWCMQQWLQGFAYHTEINAWVYLASGLVAICIAITTICSQAMRAAYGNPVDALKNE